MLPPNLTHLYIGTYLLDGNFNKKIEFLPTTLTHISLKIKRYRDNILSKIPPNVTHLFLGNNFNQPLHKNLPPNIQFLEVGQKFSHNLNSIFAASPKLTHVTISSEANKKFSLIYGKIPDYVTIFCKS